MNNIIMNKTDIDKFLQTLKWDVEFTKEEYKILDELWYNKPILDKIFNKVLNSLKNRMLKEELSKDYVLGAKASILSFKSFFKDR